MSAEENKAAMRRIAEEVFTQGKLDVADEVVTADYIEHAPVPPDLPSGLAGFKAWATGLRAAFPDFRYTVEDEVAEGDKVVQRLRASGTMRGEFGGMPPSGKHATWTEIHISRLAGGKMVEHWVMVDQFGMLQQLGFIPVPEQAGS